MEEADKYDGSEQQTGRRDVLKAGVAGLATLATGSTLAAANRSDKASDVHAAKGTVDNPVSDKRRKQLRKRAVAEYERNTGETLDGIPAARPGATDGDSDSPEDSEVVAYAYGIDADGVAHGYIGMAGEARAAESKGRAEGLIHNRFEDQVQDISAALEASDDDLTTQSAGTISGLNDMEVIYNTTLDNAVDPYGKISSTYHWVQDTEYDDQGTLHGFHSPMTIEPGYQVYGSNWQNEAAWNRHYWNQNDMAWQDVDSGYWKPAGPSGGSTSTSYSISVITDWMDSYTGLAWSYSEPSLERVDQSSVYNDYCEWEWNVTDQCGSQVRQSTLGMQPSSVCNMEDYDCAMGQRDVGTVELKGTFTDGSCGDTHWLKSSVSLYKEC
ncbi:hypothetical protein [Halorussus lipolyticus]|uniref:hypothetical protein n=1 Tax=Halorussus lipolyticus TaxID=3034024 RepID=UPI0023E8EB78|nr:hypothetical protein [Halorussus sp. DT80]